MPRISHIAIALVLISAFSAGCSSRGASQRGATVEISDPKRGRLLYETACAACHTEKAHWRDASVVRSWSELVHQVARWQKIAGQSWRAEEVEDVAAYLNGRFYRLSCPLPGCAGERISLGTGH